MAGKFSICGEVLSNTGAIDCDVFRGVPTNVIFGSASIAPEDYATPDEFKASILDAINQSNTVAGKLFPVPTIQGNTDKTVAAKYATLGYGLNIKLLRSKAGYEFDILAGTTLEKALMKFDGKTIPVMLMDDQGNIWGVTDADGNFSGTKYLVGVEPAGFGDAQNAKTTKITIAIIDAKDFTENSRRGATDLTGSDLTGLLDATPFETHAHASNVYHIGLKVITDSINSFLNVHDTEGYPALLADADQWTAGIAITTVVDDPTNDGWTMTLDTTAYAALASGAKIPISLVDVATLKEAGIVGIEGAVLTLVKP